MRALYCTSQGSQKISLIILFHYSNVICSIIVLYSDIYHINVNFSFQFFLCRELHLRIHAVYVFSSAREYVREYGEKNIITKSGGGGAAAAKHC